MERSFANAFAEMMGLKLVEAAKLDAAACRKELDQCAREMRNALISLGLRFRRGVKTLDPTTPAKKTKKGGA
jgi:hypothetical protein